MLEQDKDTWEGPDDVECKKADQTDIDVRYEGGDVEHIDRLRRRKIGHGGRMNVLLLHEDEGQKNVRVGPRRSDVGGKDGRESL